MIFEVTAVTLRTVAVIGAVSRILVMIDPKIFDDIAIKLSHVLPPELRTLHHDCQKNFRLVLQNTFAKLDFVTREEFDVQSQVLAKTRQQLDNIAKQLAELETIYLVKPNDPQQ